MLTDFMFIRPYWLLTLLPLFLIAWRVKRNKAHESAWNNVCDAHLLPWLLDTKGQPKQQLPLLLLFMSALLMIISLSGPSWSHVKVPSYHPIQPRVVLLDMSDAMLEKDVLPNRLSRAKFKLHDLFAQHEAGQFGLIVYTGEPFVVSPLTEDSRTIDALLSMLSPDIMPVRGNQLDSAMIEAQKLITQAGFKQGNILILTSKTPTSTDIDIATTLSHHGIDTSIMPILNQNNALNPLFKRFANAGNGQLIPITTKINDINLWLKNTKTHRQFQTDTNSDIQVRRDQGRFFIIPVLLLLLPLFRRGWLQRFSL